MPRPCRDPDGLLARADLPLLGEALRRVHRDERGTISVLTVIVLLVFTMILGMIINVGREIDDKVRLQNSADAASYSAGVVVARGLNAVAFTNHLLSETFALTAYFREGHRDNQRSKEVVQPILDAWEKMGQVLATAEFEKFAELGRAISEGEMSKVERERALVREFSLMTEAKADLLLPALESILGKPEREDPEGQSHLIPQFQRAVVANIPGAAQAAMQEIAERNGPSSLQGVFWRTRVAAVGTESEEDYRQRTVPLVDPMYSGRDYQQGFSGDEIRDYRNEAINRRRALAHHYLEEWTRDYTFDLGPFERESRYNQLDDSWELDPNLGGAVSAKMSQFINAWRIFTCGELRNLLENEFPMTNWPHLLRREAWPSWRKSPNGTVNVVEDRAMLDREFSFVGVVYRKKMSLTFPGMFRSPLKPDSQAFAQVSIFIPRPRFRLGPNQLWHHPRTGQPYMDPWPSNWDSFNQNWTVRLVPTTVSTLPDILQAPPTTLSTAVTTPDLGGLTIEDINTVNAH